ncbi:hypothetical protein ABHQ57_08840 [Tenacibaculum sp. ZH5_bin.1]|uniref:hypothetical protein n=1 Tax=Tenacibaculum TaxID=104267 RepID=UPI0014319D74|nr:hypothetical protein [Tenacibaculum mesophilum]KAF9657917.1 hypothetical protein HBA12_11905 [Tenacibaculum mesophilum]
MKRLILFLLFINLFMNVNAQNKTDILTNKEYVSNIGYGCEETPEPNPCAGVKMYLILNFSKEQVLITEKNISSCGSEYITSKLKYKWELTQDSIIKIYSKPEEIEYKFLKDLVLKIENDKMIGNKKYSNSKIENFIFKEKSK